MDLARGLLATEPGSARVIINKEEGWIGHQLNILGVRIWSDDTCQLVAKTGRGWLTLSAPRSLPVDVPRTAEELSGAAHDPLLTAFQEKGVQDTPKQLNPSAPEARWAFSPVLR